MISFKAFLSEARMAPLYHGTGFGSAGDILREGFKPNTYHSNKKLNLGDRSNYSGKNGVSFSRQLRVARSFGRVVFEVDQQKLSYDYKIVPIQYFQNWSKSIGSNTERNTSPARNHELSFNSRGVSNEYEEFVITNKNIPIKYITAIHYASGYDVEDKHIETIQELKAKYPRIQFKEMK